MTRGVTRGDFTLKNGGVKCDATPLVNRWCHSTAGKALAFARPSPKRCACCESRHTLGPYSIMSIPETGKGLNLGDNSGTARMQLSEVSYIQALRAMQIGATD